jgi:hypothetical protein
VKASSSKPWASNPFYRQDGPKRTVVLKAFLWLAVGLFVVGTTVSLFTGEMPQQAGQPISAADVGSAPAVEIPEIDLAAKPDGQVHQSVAQPRAALGPIRPLARLQVVKRTSSAELPPGSLFKARLVSGASNGPVRADVIEPLVVDGEERVAVGTRIVGMGQSTEERLFIRLSQLVTADGSIQELQGQALDFSDQTVGLKGTLIGNYALKLAAGAALNFAGGMSEGLQESEVKDGVAVKRPTMKNALLNGAAMAALDQSKETMSSLKSETPIIEVPAGTEFYVLVGGS